MVAPPAAPAVVIPPPPAPPPPVVTPPVAAPPAVPAPAPAPAPGPAPLILDPALERRKNIALLEAEKLPLEISLTKLEAIDLTRISVALGAKTQRIIQDLKDIIAAIDLKIASL